MAKTSLDIEKQIEQLRKEAAALKAKELAGVIGNIKEAIAHYGLTPKDLFGAGKPAKPAVAKKAGARAKRVSVIKYRDDAGHTWTGQGKRPGWFKAALESGKKAEDLLVK